MQFSLFNKPFRVKLTSPIGFVGERSISEGDDLPVYVHTTSASLVNIYFLGKTKELVESLPEISPQHQDNRYSPIDGFDWERSFLVPTTSYRSGYYLIELKDKETNREYQIPFIVKPRKTARVAVIASTNTWQAYNAYGGRSNYRDTQTPVLRKGIKRTLRVLGN